MTWGHSLPLFPSYLPPSLPGYLFFPPPPPPKLRVNSRIFCFRQHKSRRRPHPPSRASWVSCLTFEHQRSPRPHRASSNPHPPRPARPIRLFRVCHLSPSPPASKMLLARRGTAPVPFLVAPQPSNGGRFWLRSVGGCIYSPPGGYSRSHLLYSSSVEISLAIRFRLQSPGLHSLQSWSISTSLLPSTSLVLYLLYLLYLYIRPRLPSTLFSSVWVADAPWKASTRRQQRTVGYR